MDANSRNLIVNRILTRLQDEEQQDMTLLEQGGLAPETASTRHFARSRFRENLLLLGRGDAKDLQIVCKHSLELLLDNFHDMKQLVAGQGPKLNAFTIGLTQTIEFGQVSLTTDQEALWIEFLTFLNGLELGLLRVAVGGILPTKMIIQALKMVRVRFNAGVALEIPYPIKLKRDEHNALIQAVNGNKDNRLCLNVLVVGTDHYAEHFEESSKEGYMGDGSVFHSLFQVQDCWCVQFASVDVSLLDCKWLATTLLAEECPIKCLLFSDMAAFIGNGGEDIASAIKHNNSLNTLKFWTGFHDDNFTDDALAEVLKENYTIRKIHRGDVVNGGFAGAIAILNAAGRGYIQTNNDASKEDCVEVLIKVRDNLIALFLLLRENPMLFY